MPRDFVAEKDTLKDMPPLEKSSGKLTDALDLDTSNSPLTGTMGPEDPRSKFHPFTQILTLKDVESCLKLEEAVFPPHQRCSREKLIYRFSKCGELCTGLFTSAGPDSEANQLCTAATAEPVLTDEPDRKLVLLGYVIVTKTDNPVVKDEDMALPENWQEQTTVDTRLGHKEQGRTIALHSLAVVPECQKMGFGQMLLKGYIQRTQASGVADRIALLTYDKLIPFYEKFGFENKGKSDVAFGGEVWNDMVCQLQDWHDMEAVDDMS
ncbi:acetyltransferase [Viridothelium virens]|uniref:Acetyltransferase n=1 Tax=Viridothelium virens TaxID=1048519 RepID=A0A6A6HGP7_VIRVR|nr:acetyltransferase [Viridothelium virens]